MFLPPPEASLLSHSCGSSQQEAIIIALDRAHRWKKLIDDGKFATITELAEAIGMDKPFAAKLLRLALLAPMSQAHTAGYGGDDPGG